jgi:nucleolar protein 56
LSEARGAPGDVFVVETLIGVFGVTEGDEIVEHALYPPNPKQIAAAQDRQSTGEVTKEVAELIEKLRQRGFTKYLFSNRALAEAAGEKYGVETEVSHNSLPVRRLRDRLESLSVEYGLVEGASQFYALSHEVSMLMARKAVQRAHSERGAVISQSVQLLNELDKTLNVLSSKLREWYGLHFPELGRHIDDHETYARIVETFGDRGKIEGEALGNLGFKSRKSSEIVRSAQGSMGAPLIHEDLEQIQKLASHLLALYGYRPELEAHVASTAQEVAPNLSLLAGPVLAAKLMEKAGGVTKLAMKPSGTIQLLGAEKALFRAKKSGSRPPKHGLIFQHPYVHSRPRKLRGRAARMLAAKLVIAARADAFTGNPIGADLKRELDEANILGKNTDK